MSQPRHTSLSLRTQLNGLIESLPACDPSDYYSTSRLVQQIGSLRTHLERDQVGELIPACALAFKLAEVLNKDGQLGPKQTLEAIDDVLSLVCESLGIERAKAAALPTPAAESANPAPPQPAPKPATNAAPKSALKLLSNKKLGEMLIQMSLLTPAQVEQALAHQRVTGCRFGEALVQMRILPRETVESALRMQGARRAMNDNPWSAR